MPCALFVPFVVFRETIHMPNHLKMCGCKMCRGGMRHRPRMAAKVKSAVRRLRKASRIALERGQEPPSAISVGRTD